MNFVTKHVMQQHTLLTTSYHSELCTFSDFFGLDFVPRGVLFELDYLTHFSDNTLLTAQPQTTVAATNSTVTEYTPAPMRTFRTSRQLCSAQLCQQSSCRLDSASIKRF